MDYAQTKYFANSLRVDSDQDGDYSYLMDMNISSLTLERKDKLVAEQAALKQELETLRNTTAKDLWMNDLEKLEKALRSHKPSKTSSKSEKIMGPSRSAKFVEPKLTEKMLEKHDLRMKKRAEG